MEFFSDASLKTTTDTSLPKGGLCALPEFPVQWRRRTYSHLTLIVSRHSETMGRRTEETYCLGGQRLMEQTTCGLCLEESKDFYRW